MMLLVDAQLPSKLCEILGGQGIEAMHVESLPLGDESSDWDIIEYADRNNLTIVTKDLDFYHSHMALNKPKRLFLITTGNLRNRQLFDLIRKNIHSIKSALESSHLVELSNFEITRHS